MSGAHFSIFIWKEQNLGRIFLKKWICQLLELYSKCPLSAQHAKKFPTSVLEDAVHLTNQLERLSEAWVWWSDPFEYCGFGTPSIVLNEIIEEYSNLRFLKEGQSEQGSNITFLQKRHN